MKPSKYATGREPELVVPQPSARCDACGWSFVEEHFTKLPEKGPGYKRKETRTQIAIPRGNGITTRCSECYENELWRSGKHRYSSMTQQDMDEWGKHAADIATCMPQLSKFIRNLAEAA